MPDQEEPVSGTNEQTLQAEITRLKKIILALMNSAERKASLQGSDFNLFHTAITLEDQVRQRTIELEEARLETEKITRALREREKNHRLLLENSPVSIHEIDMDGKIISMSRAGVLMHGLKEESEIQGSLYLDGVSDTDRERIGKLLKKAFTGETSHFEYKAKAQHEPIFKSSFVPIKNKNGSVEKLMGITEDITERKKAEEDIRALAFYDTLTQLPNRRLLKDRMEQVMATGKRRGFYSALMFLDLDNFKSLNDTHGHDMGDLLLVEAAHRISSCVREMDTIARFGGDEFVVMLSELDTDKEKSVARAGIIAERIRITLAEPYLLTRKQEGGTDIVIKHYSTASIGLMMFFDHETSQEDILKGADIAMYQAKEGGRNTIRFFDGLS